MLEYQSIDHYYHLVVGLLLIMTLLSLRILIQIRIELLQSRLIYR